MSRRDEVIAHAADLLRTGGPDALTSVAVARRCGITQPAIYRHVRNVDELTGLASAVIVGELHAAVEATLSSPDLVLDDRDGLRELLAKIVDAMAGHARAFEIVDRWRFVDGPLGDGIRAVVDEGQRMIELVFEHEWRKRCDNYCDLDESGRRAQRSHATLLHDDAHSVARLVRSGGRFVDDHEPVIRILEYRTLMAWYAYVVDMQRRTGQPVPALDVI